MPKFIRVVSWPAEWSGENLTPLNIVTPGEDGMHLQQNTSVHRYQFQVKSLEIEYVCLKMFESFLGGSESHHSIAETILYQSEGFKV